LYRSYRKSRHSSKAVLDDYVFLISGLLSLYEAGSDPAWLNWAEELQNVLDENFWENRKHGYQFSTAKLYFQALDFYDGAKPNGNGIAALNLLKLASLTYQQAYQDRALELLSHLAPQLERSASAFSGALLALDYLTDRSKEIAIVAESPAQSKVMLESIHALFRPNSVLASGTAMSKVPLLQHKPVLQKLPTIYVCENKTCKLPTTKLKEGEKFIAERKLYKIR